jgi:hypothetical protein
MLEYSQHFLMSNKGALSLLFSSFYLNDIGCVSKEFWEQSQAHNTSIISHTHTLCRQLVPVCLVGETHGTLGQCVSFF